MVFSTTGTTDHAGPLPLAHSGDLAFCDYVDPDRFSMSTIIIYVVKVQFSATTLDSFGVLDVSVGLGRND